VMKHWKKHPDRKPRSFEKETLLKKLDSECWEYFKQNHQDLVEFIESLYPGFDIRS
jgi:hypothetical protein